MAKKRVIINFNSENDVHEALASGSQFKRQIENFNLRSLRPLFQNFDQEYQDRFNEIISGCGSISASARVLEFDSNLKVKDIIDSLQLFDQYFSFVEEDLPVYAIKSHKNLGFFLNKRREVHPWEVINYNPSSVSQTGNGVTVAVIDSGIFYKHKNFESSLWEHPDKDNCYGINVSSIGNRYDVMDSRRAHGTYVSGVIASNGQVDRVTGLAKDVDLLTIKIPASSRQNSIALVSKALVIAYVLGAKVINCSFYISRNGEESNTLNCLLQFLKDKDCIVIFAAGNFKDLAENLYPQNNDNVIVVGAINNNNKRWVLSNFGEKVTVWAPGQQIKTVGRRNNRATVRSSGTSIATPFVSAVVALLKQKKPDITFDKIKNMLQSEPLIKIDAENKGHILNVNKIIEKAT